VFVSGQGGVDPGTGKLADNVAEQTRQTMENIRAILGEFGLDLSNVIRCGIFLTDMNEFSDMNQVYASYFSADPPARTTVGVAALPVREMKVEIDAVAER
jgi:2-iminobutanoate/2-iminopropanoate deaminase